MTVCSIPTAVTASFAGISATTITLKRGESVDVDLIYETDGTGGPCTHILNWAQQKSGGLPSSFGGDEDPASKDIVYTRTFTPGSHGTWSVWGNLTWSHENPPVDSLVLPSNVLTVIAWAETEEVDAELEGRTATAAAEGRTPSATLEDRAATAGVESRTAQAGLPERTAGGGLG
jgi:hypothetical protein